MESGLCWHHNASVLQSAHWAEAIETTPLLTIYQDSKLGSRVTKVMEDANSALKEHIINWKTSHSHFGADFVNILVALYYCPVSGFINSIIRTQDNEVIRSGERWPLIQAMLC